MPTDFMDDDLLQEEEMKPTRPAVAIQGAQRLASERERTVERSANASEELERLRLRQDELEQEKAKLQELTRKQESYETSKRELSEGLNSSIVWMEKQQIQADRLSELLGSTRQRCNSMLNEIHTLQEESWEPESFGEDLSRALALLDNIRMEYNKALAKVEAEGVSRNEPTHHARGSRHLPATMASRGFLFWLKAGLAFSLPLIIVLLALFIGYLYSMGHLGG
jgi:chromosome segregation ATPase